jgi:hypothetical protein
VHQRVDIFFQGALRRGRKVERRIVVSGGLALALGTCRRDMEVAQRDSMQVTEPTILASG